MRSCDTSIISIQAHVPAKRYKYSLLYVTKHKYAYIDSPFSEGSCSKPLTLFRTSILIETWLITGSRDGDNDNNIITPLERFALHHFFDM